MKILIAISYLLLSLSVLPVFADGGDSCGPSSCRAEWQVS